MKYPWRSLVIDWVWNPTHLEYVIKSDIVVHYKKYQELHQFNILSNFYGKFNALTYQFPWQQLPKCQAQVLYNATDTCGQ